jgi:hypothetical protein
MYYNRKLIIQWFGTNNKSYQMILYETELSINAIITVYFEREVAHEF